VEVGETKLAPLVFWGACSSISLIAGVPPLIFHKKITVYSKMKPDGHLVSVYFRGALFALACLHCIISLMKKKTGI